MKVPWMRPWMLAAGLAVGAVAAGSLARGASPDPQTSDFGAILAEMSSAVGHVDEIQKRAERVGDRILTTCAYERLRNMMQAVDSAQVAKVAWEGATARGDAAAAKKELTQAQESLALVRSMRNEADNCGGRELSRVSSAGGNTSVIVTVESSVPDDDPNAGPYENWAIRPARLELATTGLSPSAASPFLTTN